jgi:hypothetical protein
MEHGSSREITGTVVALILVKRLHYTSGYHSLCCCDGSRFLDVLQTNWTCCYKGQTGVVILLLQRTTALYPPKQYRSSSSSTYAIAWPGEDIPGPQLWGEWGSGWKSKDASELKAFLSQEKRLKGSRFVSRLLHQSHSQVQ